MESATFQRSMHSTEHDCKVSDMSVFSTSYSLYNHKFLYKTVDDNFFFQMFILT